MNDELGVRYGNGIAAREEAAFRAGVEWALSRDWGWDSDSKRQRPTTERMIVRMIDWEAVDRMREEEAK